MPTLPLYTPNDVPDASHRVIAPGGYESWHFVAENASGEIRLVATFGEGDPLHPGYLSRYVCYRRRPTRRPPPVPAEYPYAHLGVYEGRELLAAFTTHYLPGEFSASVLRPEVRAGANSFAREADGTLSLRLRGTPSVRRGGRRTADPEASLSAHLTFRPPLPHAPHHAALLSTATSADRHYWVIADPSFEVSGTVSLSTGGSDLRRGREIEFRGRGYHDHYYGTGPLGWELKRWFRGRATIGGVTYAFHAARPRGNGRSEEIRLFRCDAEGVNEVLGESVEIDWAGRTGPFMPYPTALTCGTRLRLTDPQVVDASPLYTRLVYHASAPGGHDLGTAFCEVSFPRTTGWGVRRPRAGSGISDAGGKTDAGVGS